MLLDTLRSIPAPPVLIFVNSIAAIEQLVIQLRQEQFHVAGIHSEYPQELRTAILRAFREGGLDVLVCASLLERGIDLDVDEVILYEIPDAIEKVKHRAGRTGRGGRKGRVTVLITKECTILKEYKQLLKETRQVGMTIASSLVVCSPRTQWILLIFDGLGWVDWVVLCFYQMCLWGLMIRKEGRKEGTNEQTQEPEKSTTIQLNEM